MNGHQQVTDTNVENGSEEGTLFIHLSSILVYYQFYYFNLIWISDILSHVRSCIFVIH